MRTLDNPLSNRYPTHWGDEPFSDDLIRRTIRRFRWFSLCNFGNGIVAKPDSWADEPLNSVTSGVGKAEFIVRKNLPDLQGKRILDIGCNSGVIAVHLARLGAAEVIGVDHDIPEPGLCSEGWNCWKEQAEFVKAALEWRCRTTYNVRYIEANMRDLHTLDLGTFDIVLALNCLYYLEESEMARLVQHVSHISKQFLVQCNIRDHVRTLGKKATPSFIRDLLAGNGFGNVRVCEAWMFRLRGLWPYKYSRPVVIGESEMTAIS